MVQYLGLHETLEVHELLTLKNIMLTKSTMMKAMVQDEELKTILANDVTTCQEKIQKLQNFITYKGDQNHESVN